MTVKASAGRSAAADARLLGLIPAGSSAPPTSGNRRGCPAGCIASATTASSLFIDLRDTYGITQCVVDAGSASLRGGRRPAPGERGDRDRHRGRRAARTRSIPSSPPGRSSWPWTSSAWSPPRRPCRIQVASDAEFPEDTRLRYRFLDLRREQLHRNILLRAQRHREHPPADDRRPASRSSRRPSSPRARRRARATTSCPSRDPSREVLRAAPGAPAVQAALDGGGLRPLLPDRTLLPRRGRRAPTARRASSTSSTSRCRS